MKHIKKESEPEDLKEYKKLEGACFRDLSKNVKKNLRDSLRQEQGGICCYCERELKGKTVIEHIKPKERFPALQLEYSNLVLSCDGGECERKKHNRRENKNYPLYCDANKNNNRICVSPLDDNCEKMFGYGEDGEIYGLSKEANDTIAVLNLSVPFLNHQRKAVIDSIKNTDLSESEWEEELVYYQNRKFDGDFEPFCTAAIYYIENYVL
ncbi:TIGR02646 family protein [Butyrivibrio fibrisolvens]|uniref:retron system putative HNH endonuclease n=1 Tax=Pseudobutyrivibrio ruminis TaxID=46206 RepID=UPI0003FE2F94|nr:retron system putative HNH endonuclease [Pseudobutyrivibrio ruminis]MDC7278666.1 TIGR02646 family protein [Butyrivibrio fibrisolvens]